MTTFFVSPTGAFYTTEDGSAYYVLDGSVSFYPPNPIYTYVVPPKGVIEPIRFFYAKNPSDALLNWWNFSQWLDPGETIINVPTIENTFETDGSAGNLNVDLVAVDPTGTIVQARIGGGTLGRVYAVACSIVTSEGETVTKTFLVYVGQQ